MAYILIFIILILFVNKVVNGQQFIPAPRTGHTATLLEDKIYYIGGTYFADTSASDFFYLDEKFTWIDLKSQGVKFPLTAWHTSDIGGVNQDSIFIIGGAQLEATSLVYKFDTKTNAITTPIIKGKVPPRRQKVQSVSYGGKIYIFSGAVPNYNYSNNIFYNTFDILDTVNMTWYIGSSVNAPLPRAYYTATLVNGVIYYIGGLQLKEQNQDFTSMDNIYQYDIIGDTWTLKKATTVERYLPDKRVGHSAVLVKGKICIFGGLFVLVGLQRPLFTYPIAMLDTITLEWSIPPLQDHNIPSIAFHTATLIGNITNYPGGLFNDKFYLFDFGEPKIKWNGFTAQEIGKAIDTQSPTTPNTNTIPDGIIIGSTIGSIIGVCLMSVVIFFGYKYYKYYKKRENKKSFVKHAIDHF